MISILLVDDSKFTNNRTKEIVLEVRPDAEIHIALNGNEALALFENSSFKPDCAFIDYNMPEMSGLELIEKIKHKLPLERIRLLTASSAFVTGAQKVPDGVSYVAKPISPEKLREVLKAMGEKVNDPEATSAQ